MRTHGICVFLPPLHPPQVIFLWYWYKWRYSANIQRYLFCTIISQCTLMCRFSREIGSRMAGCCSRFLPSAVCEHFWTGHTRLPDIPARCCSPIPTWSSSQAEPQGKALCRLSQQSLMAAQLPLCSSCLKTVSGKSFSFFSMN